MSRSTLTVRPPVMPVAHSGTPIRFVDVRKSFGRTEVLSGISLDCPAGSTTCVIGPSGSGKSTLLRCANLLEIPDRGTIHLGDEEITAVRVDVNRVRTRIGMVFQHFHLFPNRTVLGNVTLALRRVRHLDADEAVHLAREHLDKVGMLALQDRRPHQLSGGQQQRVAIARSLAMQPEVMLFDEATSALDPELVKGILAVMRDLSGAGMTMLVVTHEMRFAREAAQQIAFVDRGRILELAPPDQIFEHPRDDRLRAFLDQML